MAKRSVVYSLIVVVLVLVLGITALLGVSYQRHQRLEDATIDFQRNLSRQENQIVRLQQQLQNCDTTVTASTVGSAPSITPPVDTLWDAPARTGPPKSTKQAPPPKW